MFCFMVICGKEKNDLLLGRRVRVWVRLLKTRHDTFFLISWVFLLIVSSPLHSPSLTSLADSKTDDDARMCRRFQLSLYADSFRFVRKHFCDLMGCLSGIADWLSWSIQWVNERIYGCQVIERQKSSERPGCTWDVTQLSLWTWC